jgi:reverse gyrase
MTDKQEILDKINELAANMEPHLAFSNTSSIEEFLDNVENQQYEEYDEIERLYNELMELSYYDDDEELY